MRITSEIIKSYKPWKNHKDINLSLIKAVLKSTLKHFPHYKYLLDIEVVILLTDNIQMRTLNFEFRGKNKPTNVLSFPEIEINPKIALEFKPQEDHMHLGDIAFGYETIVSEAFKADITFHNHFTHLLIHGILHLLGMDHVKKTDAVKMQRLEVEILQDFGIASPYDRQHSLNYNFQ